MVEHAWYQIQMLIAICLDLIDMNSNIISKISVTDGKPQEGEYLYEIWSSISFQPLLNKQNI